MTDSRVTSVVVESLVEDGPNDMRITSVIAETMVADGPNDMRVTALIVETMYEDTTWTPAPTTGSGWGIPAGIS